MAVLCGNFVPIKKPLLYSKSAIPCTYSCCKLPVKSSGIERRGLLRLFISTVVVSEATDSRKALLQEYLRRSKENKEKNDKERLEDYYKRNYKDYFDFLKGSFEDKKEEELSESEKGILEWLRKNSNK